jgi:translation initiation factor 4E
MDGSVTAMETMKTKSDNSSEIHHLSDTWTLWAHLPHDTDWSLKSYKKILTFNSVEKAISIIETLPIKMIKNCMLFLMREGIKPTWEDEKNRKGGCFSYKVSNKAVGTTWKNISYSLVGEALSKKPISKDINGITISPKKNFCVIKIWMANCKCQDPSYINQIDNTIVSKGCLFRKHNPEY